MARGIGRPMAVLVLSDEERSYLERQARRRRVARSLSDRCRMILRCAGGLTNKAVALELGVHEHTVGKWRRRFLKERIDGLSDEPRPGRPRRSCGFWDWVWRTGFPMPLSRVLPEATGARSRPALPH